MKRAIIAGFVLLTATTVFAQEPVTGFPPFGSFQDGINRQNLNVNLGVPIVSVPGRVTDFAFGIVHDSLIWKKTTSGTAWTPVTDASGVAIWGWKKTLVTGSIPYKKFTFTCYRDNGTHFTATQYGGYAYVDPSGTRHSFNVSFAVPDCVGGIDTGYATDGSGYYLDASSGDLPLVFSTSGMKIVKDGTMTDTNGNIINSSVAGTVTTWKDTAGHDALKIDNVSSTQIDYKYYDTSGALQTWRMTLQSFNIKSNFACSGVGEYTGSAYLPTEIKFLPIGPSYTFTYEPTPSNSGYYTGRLLRVTLPTGGYYEYVYPGNPVSTTHNGINCSDGTVVDLTRNINDGTTTFVWHYVRTQVGSDWKNTVTPPTNDISTFTFNSSGQLTSTKLYQGAEQSQNLKRTINTAWTNGTPSSQTVILEDNSTQSKTETTFDNYGNLTQLIEYGWGTGAPGAAVRTTQNTYLNTSAYTWRNIVNRPTQVLVRSGGATGTIKSRTDVVYDETTYSNSVCPASAAQHDDTNYGCAFYTRGNPTSVTTYTNAAAPSGGVTRHSTYDWFGNLRVADVNCCQQKQFNFSSTTQYAYPYSVVSGPSSGWQYTTNATYDSSTGLVASTTNEQNRTTSFTYDPRKRIYTVTRPDSQQVTYAYDDTNRVVTVESPLDGTNRLRQKSYFDPLGRPSKSQSSDSAGNNCSETQAQYDNLGRAFKQSNPIQCGGTASYWTQSAFDSLGRVTSVTAPDNSQTTYAYSGASVTITDPTNKQRKSETDALGRMTKVTEPDVNNGNALTQETTYAYSVLDLLTSVTQGSQTRSYTYDDMGRLTQQATPEGGTWNYTYNVFNQVLTRTDARSVITTNSYDTLNRLTQVSYDVGSTGVPTSATVTYAYGSPIETDQDLRGRLKTVTDGPGTEGYTYDNLGLITQFQKVINSTTYTTSYTFNLAGEMLSITYPSGRVVTQSYDIIGRLTAMESDSGATRYLNNLNYDTATGLVTSLKYGNNAVDATFSYSSDRLQLSTLSYKKVGDTNPFLSMTYGYGSAGSNNGQITGITDNVDSGRTVAYTYDALYRLKIAETTGSTGFPKWGLQWTYDRYGNRTAQSIYSGCTGITCPTNSIAVSATTNRITDSGYGYDANGNMTADGRNTLVYDAENHTVSSTYQGATATYTYDGAGLRVKKISGATTTVYVFSGTKVIAEYENGAAPTSATREYIYSGGALVATHEAGALKFHYPDHLSARVTSDSAGANRVEQGHFPYGESWYESTGATKWKFTSYERDPESANDYAMARYHVNRLGRFSSPDPMAGSAGDPQSLNRYAYTRNNPINLIDPLGLEDERPYAGHTTIQVPSGPLDQIDLTGLGEGFQGRTGKRPQDDPHTHLPRGGVPPDVPFGPPPGGPIITTNPAMPPPPPVPPADPCKTSGTPFELTPRNHPARDYGTTGYGANILAPETGTVNSVRSGAPHAPGPYDLSLPAPPANYVQILTDTGFTVRYTHVSPSVSSGASVVAGQVIGFNDNSGRTTGPHTHVSVRDSSGTLIDPNSYFPDCR